MLLVACFRWTPHAVIVTMRDNRDYIRVLLYSYYTTITGWGVLLRHAHYLKSEKHPPARPPTTPEFYPPSPTCSVLQRFIILEDLLSASGNVVVALAHDGPGSSLDVFYDLCASAA